MFANTTIISPRKTAISSSTSDTRGLQQMTAVLPINSQVADDICHQTVATNTLQKFGWGLAMVAWRLLFLWVKKTNIFIHLHNRGLI